jgi:integrase
MIVTSLGSIIADAQERGLESHNPVREMRKNRGKRGRKANGREKPLEMGVEIPEAAEIRRILAKAAGRRRALVAVLAFAGLRASEMRGLRCSDIDLDGHALSVRQRADQGGDIGEAKSLAGYRTVPLMPLVVNALKEWRLACPKSTLYLVFPNGKGNVETHQNIVQRHWHKLQLAAGVVVPLLDKAGKPVVDKKGKPVLAPKYSGLHNLRHFFASWCIARQEAGGLALDPKTVQIRCGHASIKQTLDRYGHLWPANDDAALMAAAERAFQAG